MRRPLLSKTLLFLLLTLLTHADDPTVLQIEEVTSVLLLPAEQNRQYTFTIPDSISEKEEVYIRAQPLLPDPFQIPYLKLTSSNNYQQNCFNAHSELISYCRIPAIQAKPKRQFQFIVSCSVECHLNLSVYISNFVKVRLGEELSLSATNDVGLLTIVNVPIPLNDSYSGLAVNALIANLEETIDLTDGLIMLINHGDRNAAVPTEESFQIQAEEMYSGGRFAYLTRQKVAPGSWLKVYLKLRKGMRVVFSVTRAQDQFTNLELGHSFFDLVKKGQQKTYLLNTSSYHAKIQDKTIELVFDKFAGTPDIAIAFDSPFLKQIPVTNKFPAVSLELSPTLRQEKGFNKLIYIRVTAIQDSEFYFYSQITREDATYLKPYIAYFDELTSTDIYTYIFDERYVIEKVNTEATFIRNYTFRVDVLAGKGRFFFTRCRSLQKEINASDHSLSKCLKKKQDIHSLQFVEQEIEAKTILSGGMMVINMEYDISKCPLLEVRDYQKGSGGRQYRGCVFQMIAEGVSPDPWSYIVTAQRKNHISYLHEGKMTKQYLPKDTSVYYVFALPDYANVEEVSVFSITYSGQSVLLVSKKEKYPTLQTKNVLADTGSRTNIVLKGEELQSELYVSVLAKSFTQVNVGVVVHRKGEAKGKEIKLQNGNILPYTLNRGQTQVKFRFIVKLASDIVVQLNELVGFVEMKVLDSNNKEMACNRDGSLRAICRFFTNRDNAQYTVVVTGEKSKEQQFTISYSDNGRCKAFALNTPIYVQMEGIVMNCYTFLAHRAVSLKYASSLTGVQTVERQITVDIAFNGYVFQQIYDNQHEVALRDMITQCPLGKKTKKSDFIASCSIELRFFSTSNNTNNFYFLLEQIDQEMALFDGILQKVNGIFVFAQQPKYFYYKVTQDTSIKIFASTTSFLSEFLVVASLVSKEVFAKRQANQEIYPKFIPASDRTNASTRGLFFTNIGKTGTSVLSISSDRLLDDECGESQCWLLLAVYPDLDSFQKSEGNEGLKTSYQLEVTQRERTLELGETKTGFVTEGSVEVFVVSPADGLVTLRNVQNQDLRNGVCASVTGGVSNGTITKRQNIIGGGYLQLSRTDGVQHIVVRGTLPQCSYQISYQRLSQPVHNAKLSQPYALDLASGQAERFLYYHSGQVSFRLVKLVSAGVAEVFIYPIKSREQSLADLLKRDYKTFPIAQAGDRPLVFSEDPNFCEDCYYLVVVAAPSKFVGEVIFLRERDPIPLSTNHALKDWLLPNSLWNNASFIYYSLTDYNLTFEVISGTIRVTVRDPKGVKLFQEEVKDRTNFKVKAQGEAKGDVEFYSQGARYQIEVQGLSQSQFYLKVDKNRPTERIFEGMPATFQISRLFPLALQFINSEKIGVALSLMVEVTGRNGSFSELQFSVHAQGDSGKVVGDRAMVLKQVMAEHTYILTLKSIQGSYYVSITASADTTLNILLMRRQLTQLSPLKSYLLNGQGIFQLYSSKRKMLVQIYNCVGDFNIFASKDIRQARSADPSTPSPITLRRPNYGGHYVFEVDQIFSSYYMRISPKQKSTELQYFISYQYNDGLNPYELIDANNYQLEYRQLQEGIALTLNPPKMAEGAEKHLQLIAVTYYVYLSNNKQELLKYSRCGIQGAVVELQVANITNFIVEKSILQSLIEKEPRPESVFITVQATIQIGQTEHNEQQGLSSKLSNLTVLYNVAQVPLSAHKYAYWFTDSLVILLGWMFLPFVLAAVVLFYLLKYCMRRLMRQQANMVEEQIVADPNSRPTVGTEQRIQEGIVYPDSAAVQMVKEHI